MKVGQLGQNQADSGSWFPAVFHQVSPPSSIILGGFSAPPRLFPLLSVLSTEEDEGSRVKRRGGLGFLPSVWFPVCRWEDVETVAAASSRSAAAFYHPATLWGVTVTSPDWFEASVWNLFLGLHHQLQIAVERGQFDQPTHCESPGWWVNLRSTLSHTLIFGSGGCFNECFWTFRGPSCVRLEEGDQRRWSIISFLVGIAEEDHTRSEDVWREVRLNPSEVIGCSDDRGESVTKREGGKTRDQDHQRAKTSSDMADVRLQ